MEPRSDKLSSPERIDYPPDLISAIAEARRNGRVDEDPETTQFLIQDGYEQAARMIKRSPSKNAEYWTIYHTVNGQLAYLGDCLELARTNPALAGDISPQSAYGLLSIAYERHMGSLTHGKLELPASLGRAVSHDEINSVLDTRKLLNQLVDDFKNKSGDNYQQVLDKVNSPEFNQFKLQIGHALNPEFLESAS